MEPAIKPAVLENKNEKVAVFATSLTLKEEKFNRLEKSLHARHVIEQINCDGLANLIDRDDIPSCIEYLDPILKELRENNINNFVLGCTHYLLIRPLFYKYNDNIKIYDGNQGTIRHIISSLSIPEVERESRIELFLNGGTDDDFQIAYRYLNANPREDRKYVK
jgi:glutamate racemase